MRSNTPVVREVPQILPVLNTVPTTFQEHHQRQPTVRRKRDGSVCLVCANDTRTSAKHREIMSRHDGMSPIKLSGANDHTVGWGNKIGIECRIADRLNKITNLSVTVVIAKRRNPLPRR